MTKLQLVVAMSTTLILPVAAASQSSPAATGTVEAGKRLFEKDGCYQCHGYAAQGGRDGARLAATLLNGQAFSRYVRRPFGAMPAFTQKVLSDPDLTDIFAYVKALPAAKPATDIPLLNRLRDK